MKGTWRILKSRSQDWLNQILVALLFENAPICQKNEIMGFLNLERLHIRHWDNNVLLTSLCRILILNATYASCQTDSLLTTNLLILASTAQNSACLTINISFVLICDFYKLFTTVLTQYCTTVTNCGYVNYIVYK